MPSLGHVLPPRPVARQACSIPPGSVLAAANRKADAVVTIGPWRVVFIPDAPVRVPEACHGSPPCALHEDVVDAGDSALPAGLVFIHVDQPTADQAVAQLADPLALGSRFKPAAPSPSVAPGPLGSVSLSALSWALLSQVVWVPLLALDVHDRWVARQRDITPPGQPLPPSPIAQATRPLHLNGLLGAARPRPPLAGQADQAGSGPLGQVVPWPSSAIGVLLSRSGSMLDRPFTSSLDTPAAPSAGAGRSASTGLPPVAPLQGPGLLGRAFTRAQLLGGIVSLADLQEGPMAPLALAERALQRSGNDPLAPLPELWREPMRQALLKLPGAPQRLDTARIVYVPSSSVSQPVEVPLALQSDGSVDILEAPANAALLREINSWSRQQRPPASGSLVPAVVRLHPLPQAATIAPPASGEPAVTQPRELPASIPVPIARETTAPQATAAPIPVPILSEAPASQAPAAADSGDPVVPAP